MPKKQGCGELHRLIACGWAILEWLRSDYGLSFFTSTFEFR